MNKFTHLQNLSNQKMDFGPAFPQNQILNIGSLNMPKSIYLMKNDVILLKHQERKLTLQLQEQNNLLKKK